MIAAPPPELQFIDEHQRTVSARANATWDALGRVLTGRIDGLPPALARVWGLTPARAAGPRPLGAGSALPGFRVTEAVPGRRLILDGEHRFSRYRLEFLIAESRDRSHIRARSYAVFPGPHGAIYRTLVIDSRAHVLAVRHLLTSIAWCAERRSDRDRPTAPRQPGLSHETGV